MAVISTGSHPAALWPGVQAWYGNAYKDFSPEYTALFEVMTSDKAYEEDIVTKPFGLATVKEEGATITYDSHSQGYTKRYTHVTYGSGYIVTEEELEDNQYAAVSGKRAPMLARSLRKTTEIIAANVYNNAFTSGYTGGDGSVLCVTSHATAAGNQSNTLTVAADLSEASLEDLCVLIMGMQDERGLIINAMPQSLHVPRQLIFEATRILKSVQQSGTVNNDINAMRNLGYLTAGPQVNHYLTDTDAFFIRTDVPDSMKFLWRRKPTSPQMDNDFDTSNAKTKATMRFSCGWSDWRGVAGSPGA
jgi:hypothetical protein